jgi:hypothetical protein
MGHFEEASNVEQARVDADLRAGIGGREDFAELLRVLTARRS